jgi:EAL domain-containing protein (putative c-di-GMP-specific phosphodiesterase class I)/GGDEF domain-containing protein
MGFPAGGDTRVGSNGDIEHLLRDDRLHSVFQAIVDLDNGQVHGYEALIRGPEDSPLHLPDALFAAAQTTDRLAELEIAACSTHLQRFARAGCHARLFLNLSPSLVESGRMTNEVLARLALDAGLSPRKIVIELTEDRRVEDYANLRWAIEGFHRSGFDMAIDDLGSGYSGLRQWSELKPGYVKIDRHFVCGADEDANKRQFIHAIVEIGRTLGALVIAEGVETQEEFEVVRALGVPYGQGFWFGRPARQPPAIQARAQLGGLRRRAQFSTTQTIGSILRQGTGIDVGTLVEEAADHFQTQEGLRCLVVTRDGLPRGVLTRHKIMSLYASRYGRDLFGRRPVSAVMSEEFVQVPVGATLDQISERITRDYDELPEQDLVVTDEHSRFVGTASFLQLLKAITTLQVRSARYANPLTQLPGSVPINERIDHLLLRGESFCVAYADLDNFKPFNDVYGYAMGDDVIRLVAQLLTDEAFPGDLVGHVGGDDFILVMLAEDWESRCRRILARFEEEVPRFYRPEDRAAGGVHSHDRQGNLEFFPFLSLSIGATRVRPYAYGSHQEVASVASEVKHLAKRKAGNSLFIDRRRAAGTVNALDDVSA